MKPNLLCLLSAASLLAFNASAQVIIQIASDTHDSSFVKSDGSLWQGDAFRQKGNWSPGREPIDLIVSNGVTAVAMSHGTTFFVKDNGSLWAMGDNASGFLGDGTLDTPDHPIQIVPSGVIAVTCGENNTFFLKDDGSMWGFGENGHGALGTNGLNDMLERPTKIVTGEVVAIAAGYYHSLFIKRDGTLWGMGNNNSGQLGLGSKIKSVNQPVKIASNVVQVAAGTQHSLFIKSDGSLWAMGVNDAGQVGNCTDVSEVVRPEQVVPKDVVAITAGYEGSLFLKKDGSLWGMGSSFGSDYGLEIEFDFDCPKQIMASTNSALVAGYYYNAKLQTCSSIWADKFNSNLAGVSTASIKSQTQPNLANLPGYNLITIELLKNGNVRLTYKGGAGARYALDRSSSLVNPNWMPLVTNTAPVGGVLVITNTPDTTVNNFWRIRSVP